MNFFSYLFKKNQIINLTMLSMFFLSLIFSLQEVKAEIFIEDNFDNLTEETWSYKTGRITRETSGCRSGYCVKASITPEKDMYPLQYSLKEFNLSEIYVRYYFKRTNWPGSGGCKSLKIFGVRSGSNYANSTFMQHYDSGIYKGIQSGDWITIEHNDSSQGFSFNQKTNDYVNWPPNNPGYYIVNGTSHIPNVYKSSSMFNEHTDEKWHSFEVYHKYNTGTGTEENWDGAFKVWIDGILRYDVRDIRNRHNDNSSIIDYISFVDYQTGSTGPWEMWIDEVVVSDKHIGTLDKPVTKPLSPKGFRIKKKQ